MLTAVVADRPEDLVERLADELRHPAADGSGASVFSVASLFTPEWVSVPSLGMRTWLRSQLSRRLGAGRHGDGVSANIDYPFPGTLRWAILDAHRAAAGLSAHEVDPWHVDRLVWSLLEVLSEPPDDLDERLVRRVPGVSLASRAGPLADLFDQYLVHRPQMVLAWLDGRDVGADLAPVHPQRAWQPALFRAVHQHIATYRGVPTTPAERLADALEQLRDGSLDVGPGAPRPLPQRLFVVGQSLITAELGPLLSALAVHRDVHLLLSSPSALATVDVARRTAALRPPVAARAPSWAVGRSVHDDAAVVDHPLLRTWGSRPLDTAVLLGAGGVIPEPVPAPELVPATLLERLQHDLRAGSIDPAAFTPSSDDDSVQLHGAPGRTRQVEVLRDVICGLLRDDPTLSEGDVAVVCPQLDEFVPIITAVLGPSAGRGTQPDTAAVPALRYTVVDRSARSFNPVLDGLATLLDLLPGRFDAASVRGFFALPAVRQRFGLGDDDLDLAARWVTEARLRWGLDEDHRRRWGVEGGSENSWRSGVEQLLMGVALGDDLRDAPLPGGDASIDPVARHALAPGGVAPMPLADGDLAAAGRLAAVLHALGEAHRRLVAPGPRPIAQWCDDLTATVDELFAADRFEEWQRARVDETIAALATASHESTAESIASSSVALELADLRRLLSPSLDGVRTRADLGHGSIVIAQPSLLQSVPHRVVCVLGLDAEALPASRATGDDLLHLTPMVGDRDPRAEARAELLAAIGAARDTLVVTFSSTDLRNNTKVPEAVVLDELVEVLALTLGVDVDELRMGRRVGGAVSTPVVRHPRQAFDPANFTVVDGRQPTGFDPVALAGAQVLQRGERADTPTGVLIDEPLPAVADGGVVELAELRGFFRHPGRSFFRGRLDVVVPERVDAADVELPTSLGHLDRSSIGRDLVAVGVQRCGFAGLAGGPAGGDDDLTVVLDSVRARGVLPPDLLIEGELETLCVEASAVLEVADHMGVCRPATVSTPVDIATASGVRIVGTVTGCVDGDEQGPARVGFSRPKPHWRLQLAIDLAALTLVDPSVEWRASLAARAESKKSTEPVALTLQLAGGDQGARRHTAALLLDDLVAIRADGLRLPLPLFDSTSHALAAGGKWKDEWGNLTGQGSYKEAADRYHQLAFGPLTADELLELDVAGHTLRGEAERLWGAYASAVIEQAVELPQVDPDDAGGDQ